MKKLIKIFTKYPGYWRGALPISIFLPFLTSNPTKTLLIMCIVHPIAYLVVYMIVEKLTSPTAE